jgi:hypothetical protein
LSRNWDGNAQEHRGHPPTGTGPHGYLLRGRVLMRVAVPHRGRAEARLVTDGPGSVAGKKSDRVVMKAERQPR